MKAVRLLPLVALLFTAAGIFGADQSAAVADLKQRVAALADPVRQGPGDFTTWTQVKFDAWKTPSLIRPFAAHVEGIRTVVRDGKIVENVRFVAKLEFGDEWSLSEVAVSRGSLIAEPEPVKPDSAEWAVMASALKLSARQP